MRRETASLAGFDRCPKSDRCPAWVWARTAVSVLRQPWFHARHPLCGGLLSRVCGAFGSARPAQPASCRVTGLSVRTRCIAVSGPLPSCRCDTTGDLAAARRPDQRGCVPALAQVSFLFLNGRKHLAGDEVCAGPEFAMCFSVLRRRNSSRALAHRHIQHQGNTS